MKKTHRPENTDSSFVFWYVPWPERCLWVPHICYKSYSAGISFGREEEFKKFFPGVFFSNHFLSQDTRKENVYMICKSYLQTVLSPHASFDVPCYYICTGTLTLPVLCWYQQGRCKMKHKYNSPTHFEPYKTENYYNCLVTENICQQATHLIFRFKK